MKFKKIKWTRKKKVVGFLFLLVCSFLCYHYYCSAVETRAWARLEQAMEDSVKFRRVIGLYENSELKEGNYHVELKKKNSLTDFFSNLKTSTLANSAIGYRMISSTESTIQKTIGFKHFDKVDLVIIHGTDLTGLYSESFPSSRSVVTLDLNLKHSSPESLKILEKFPNLRSLRIEGLELTEDSAKYFEDCSELRTLAVVRSRQISDKVLANIARLQKLNSFDIPDTKISETGFEHIGSMKKLWKLQVYETNLTNKGLEQISKLQNLGYLIIEQNPIDDEGVQYLARLKKLNHLSLSATLISNESLKVLGQLPRLKKLYLHDTLITDEGIKHLSQSRSLKSLNLGTNTAYLPESLECKLTDACVPYLVSIPNIKNIYISRSRITDVGRKQIADRLKLGPDSLVTVTGPEPDSE